MTCEAVMLIASSVSSERNGLFHALVIRSLTGMLPKNLAEAATSGI
jgi:hypothetical protein